MLKIKLEDNEVKFLQDFVNKGQKNAREITRARILQLVRRFQIMKIKPDFEINTSQ